jgi:hypothetical protein
MDMRLRDKVVVSLLRFFVRRFTHSMYLDVTLAVEACGRSGSVFDSNIHVFDRFRGLQTHLLKAPPNLSAAGYNQAGVKQRLSRNGERRCRTAGVGDRVWVGQAGGFRSNRGANVTRNFSATINDSWHPCLMAAAGARLRQARRPCILRLKRTNGWRIRRADTWWQSIRQTSGQQLQSVPAFRHPHPVSRHTSDQRLGIGGQLAFMGPLLISWPISSISVRS